MTNTDTNTQVQALREELRSIEHLFLPENLPWALKAALGEASIAPLIDFMEGMVDVMDSLSSGECDENH